MDYNFQLQVLEIYGILSTAGYAAWDVVKDTPWTGAASRTAACDRAWAVAGGAARDVACHTALAVTGNAAWVAAWRAVGDVVKYVTQAVARTELESSGSVGVGAARGVLWYVITNEEEICLAIGKLVERKIKPKVTNSSTPTPSTIDTLLNVNPDLFKKMNIGGKCWYMYRIWRLIQSVKTVDSMYQKHISKLQKVVGRQEEMVKKFMGRVYGGVEYSRVDLMQSSSTMGGVNLIGSLISIIYEFLDYLPSKVIRREILHAINML